jgi:hypothetical protein
MDLLVDRDVTVAALGTVFWKMGVARRAAIADSFEERDVGGQASVSGSQGDADVLAVTLREVQQGVGESQLDGGHGQPGERVHVTQLCGAGGAAQVPDAQAALSCLLEHAA